MEKTLSIIKPDAVARNLIGDVLQYFEHAGLRVVAAKMVHMTREQAERFYSVHKEKPFFQDLVGFMTSGPVMVQVLEGDEAVARTRTLMGATDPQKADPGTIRANWGSTVERNAVHGSDSLETARHEIEFFFTSQEIYPRQ